LDTLGKDEKSTIPLSVYSCQNGVSANQYLSLSKKDQLRREDVCSVTMDSTSVVLASCNFADQKQTWTHEKVKYIQQYFQINFVLSLSHFRMDRLFIFQVNFVLTSKVYQTTIKLN
jgi:hypothetical protein